MSDYTQVGESFVNWYYTTSNNSRVELAHVYTADSIVTFQNDTLYGQSPSGELKIMEKLNSQSLSQMTKKSLQIMCQPSVQGTVLIFVQGSLKMTPEEAEEIQFQEVFLIAPDQASGSFFVINQIFSTSGF